MSEEKMWVIGTGAYSDQQVVGVTRSKELAEKIVERSEAVDMPYGDNVWSVGVPLFEQMPEGRLLLQMTIYIDREGNLRPISDYSAKKFIAWPWDEYHYEFGECDVDSDGSEIGYDGQRYLSVIGTDHEKVRKVFGELKMRRQAEQIDLLRLEQEGQQ